MFAWVGRVWNARASRTCGELVPGIPDDWGPVLDAIGRTYLPYLAGNGEAWKAKAKRFDVQIESVTYRQVPMSRYRVWCLERLRAAYEALTDDAKTTVRSILEAHGCWYALWHVEQTDSGYDPDDRAPFARGIAVYGR